jgi:hypothetical protein
VGVCTARPVHPFELWFLARVLLARHWYLLLRYSFLAPKRLCLACWPLREQSAALEPGAPAYLQAPGATVDGSVILSDLQPPCPVVCVAAFVHITPSSVSWRRGQHRGPVAVLSSLHPLLCQQSPVDLANFLRNDDHAADSLHYGCKLDREQQKAVGQALSRRVALIQGITQPCPRIYASAILAIWPFCSASRLVTSLQFEIGVTGAV